MKKLFIAFLCLLCMGVVGASDRTIHERDSVEMQITTVGDTAQVTTFYVESAVDSFLYIDSFSYQADTTKHKTITYQTLARRVAITPTSALDSFMYIDSIRGCADTVGWASPVQVMRFILTGNTGDVTKLDTVGIGVVTCSVAFAGGETLGIEYDLSTGADSTIATALDSIVAIFNGATNLTDSVEAEDSATYIKLISSFSQEAFGGRWSLVMSSDSTDSNSSITSIAMVCDSMTAYINAKAGTSDSLVASDSGTYYVVQNLHGGDTTLNTGWMVVPQDTAQDTATSYAVTIEEIVDSLVSKIGASANLDSFITVAKASDTSYTITADDPGVLFYACVDDSAQDSALTQANVTSRSIMCDTIRLVYTISADGQQYKGVNGVFYLDSTLQVDSTLRANQGISIIDSAEIVFAVGRERWLPTGKIFDVYELDSANCDSLPCSLKVSRDPAAAGVDTLFKEYMYLIIYVSDTATDTNTSVYYNLYKDLLLLDD